VYELRLWKGNALLSHTTHSTLASLYVEVSASRARRDRGEASRIEVKAGPLGWKQIEHEHELAEK
jgi:hypothetical protein